MAAINTATRRQAAMLDTCGMLFPDASIDAFDRQALVGDYLTDGIPPTSTTAPEVFSHAGGRAQRSGSTMVGHWQYRRMLAWILAPS